VPKKKKTEYKPSTPLTKTDTAPYWSNFFRDQRCPVVRSQLITALMAGRQLEVERLPTAALADAVMLSMVSRYYFEAEIIDDYPALLRTTEAKWKEPMFCHEVFNQMHLSTVSFVVRGSDELVCYEDQYIPSLVGWWLNHDVPEYFAKELV
jgi:hypothetical protein